MRKYITVAWYGIISWAIPFIVSFAFFDMKTKALTIDEMYFKSIMIVLGGLVGCLLLIRFFHLIEDFYIKEGFIAGIIMMSINLLLDVIILLPMSKMPFILYYQQIGMRYLLIPIIATTMGMAIQDK
ncbi:MAG: hypothetical protein A2Y40_07310 [Candidatus Margulisbacteria bacterium GWF2_35_9]|nr:MAG: hypothetical protein A2Y40_07310 [Candidatus Margulisbacteria bacterium GWF2_35_9]